MFFPEQQVRVFLYGALVDMRRSFDGLYVIARHGMPADPLAGCVFQAKTNADSRANGTLIPRRSERTFHA